MSDVSIILRRPLVGWRVSISVSESNDSAALGFPAWQVNRVTLQVVSALFGQGASVVFGHDWREDGVMEAVHGFARQMQAPMPTDDADGPMLVNLLPWPDKPSLSEEELRRLEATLRVEPAGLPFTLRYLDEKAQASGPTHSLYRYARARGLTFLRRRLTEQSDVRLCIGGRRAGSAGRYPGVIEEALLAVQASKPLYVAGLLGGAAKQVIDALQGRSMPKDFCPPGPAHELYRRPPAEELDADLRDRELDREAVWQELATEGRVLAHRLHLKPEELEELFHSRVTERVIELMLISLSRLGL